MQDVTGFIADNLMLLAIVVTAAVAIAVGMFAGRAYQLYRLLAQYHGATPVLLYPVREPESGSCHAGPVSYRGLVWRIALVNPADAPALLERARLECQTVLGRRGGKWKEWKSGWALVLEDGREYDPVRPHVESRGSVLVLQVVLHETAAIAAEAPPVSAELPNVRLRVGFQQRRQTLKGAVSEWVTLESASVPIPLTTGLVEVHSGPEDGDEPIQGIREL